MADLDTVANELANKIGLSPDDVRRSVLSREAAESYYKGRPRVDEDSDLALAIRRLRVTVWQQSLLIEMLVDQLSKDAFKPRSTLPGA